MSRTAEVVFIGDAVSIVRAAQEASAATEGTVGKIDASSARIAKANETAAKSATKMARDFALAGVGVIAASVDMAVKAEAATASIAKSAGTSAAAAKKIEVSFRGLSDLEYSGNKVASAFATIASELRVVEGRALTTTQATKTMEAALDLTDASGGKLTGTTEALGKVMLTYGLHAKEAAKASDILFNASKQTGTTVEQVAQVVDRMRGRLGALAPTLGETTGLMDELAKKGISGRQSLQALNGMFSTLLGNSKATTAVAKELGLQIFDQSGKFVGLKNVIGQLNSTLPKYNQETQLAYTRALFGAGANKQLLEVIHQGPSAYAAATTAVEKHGAAAEAAAKEHETLEGKLNKARASAENLGEALGEKLVPDLTAVEKKAETVVKWLGKHKEVAEALAKVVEVTLGGALTVYAYTKAAAFVGATKDMIGAVKGLAATMGLIPTAAEAASAKAIAAQTTTTTFIASSDGTIVAANEAAGASFTALLGPIAAVAGAAAAAWVVLDKVLPGGSRPENLLGGNQPGEKTKEGSEGQSGPYKLKSKAGAQATGGSVEQQIIKFWVSKGFSPVAAAGFAGNAKLESGLNPKEPGGGLYQQSGDGASGTGSVAAQSQQVLERLSASLKAQLKHASSPAVAANLIAKYFERPAGSQPGEPGYGTPEGGTAHIRQREEAAARAYGGTSGPSVESLLQKAKKAKKQAKLFTPHGGLTGFFEAPGTDYTKGKEEEIAERLDRLGKADKIKLLGISGYRSAAHSLAVGGFADDPHTRGEASDTEGAQKIAEAILRKFGLTRPFPGAKEADHIQLLPGVKPLARSGGSAELGTASSALEAIRKAEKEAEAHLLLTVAQKTAIKNIQAIEVNARQGVEGASGLAAGVGETWQRARGVQESKRKPLSTDQGAHEAVLIDRTDILTTQAQKKLYQRAVRELEVEVKALQKLRKQYLSFASHAKGNAKKEALNRASQYAGRIKQAQEEAKAYGGHIADSEAAIETAQNVLTGQLPEEIGAADLSAYQAANNKIDMEVRAGVKTEGEGKAAKEGNAQRALAGGYGSLSPEGILQVKGDLLEFSKATTEATSALEVHTEALKESAKALTEFAHIADAIGVVEAGSFAKSLADSVNGQIGGIASGRQLATVGSGSAARY